MSTGATVALVLGGVALVAVLVVALRPPPPPPPPKEGLFETAGRLGDALGLDKLVSGLL